VHSYFAECFQTLPASPVARAYLTGLFTQQAVNPIDYSKASLVLTYAQVRSVRDLETLQAVGDWVLWVDTMLPAHQATYREAAQSIGRASYYRCYRLVREWRVYEELADTLPRIVNQLRVLTKPVDTTESEIRTIYTA